MLTPLPETPKLRRWTFLLPLALSTVAMAVTGAAGEAAAEAASDATTVYVVRHAEKQSGQDPELTPQGEARARDLAHVLMDAGVDAVYTTDWKRTRHTGEPVAAAAGVEIGTYATPAELAEKIRADHGGDTVLVVGHSNTVDDLVASLGVPGLTDLDEKRDYDRLYVLHLDGSEVFLERLRYGEPPPADED